MSRIIEVRTAARLHFGLSSFGSSSHLDRSRQYGGVGMMVGGVGVHLRLSPAQQLCVAGLHARRVHHFAENFWDFHQLSAPPACKLEVLSSPPDHVGLGIGTQLGLAVVAGLAQWLELNWRDGELLSRVSQRGSRSAVGTHGFLHGGLIVDGGKLADEQLGILMHRVDVPSDWRFVLVRPQSQVGLSGQHELTAISSLPPFPAKITEALHAIVDHRMLPAAKSADFGEFSNALFDYGYQAGECLRLFKAGHLHRARSLNLSSMSANLAT